MKLQLEPVEPIGRFFGMELEYESEPCRDEDEELICGHTEDADCPICRNDYRCDYVYRDMVDDCCCALSGGESVRSCLLRTLRGGCTWCRHSHGTGCYTGYDGEGIQPDIHRRSSIEWVEDRGATGFCVPADWEVKPDGSLRHGFETTTPTLESIRWTPDRFYTLLRKVFRNLRSGGAIVEPTCGCHIHLSLPQWPTNYERNKWQRRFFLTVHNQQSLLYQLAIGGLDEHRGERYCYPLPPGIVAQTGKHIGSVQVRLADHYGGVNFSSHYPTTEWRMFNSTLQPEIACSWYLLVQHLASYTQYNPPLPPCSSVKQLLRIVDVPKQYDEWFDSYFDLQRNEHRSGSTYHVSTYSYSYRHKRTVTANRQQLIAVGSSYIERLIAKKGAN